MAARECDKEAPQAAATTAKALRSGGLKAVNPIVPLK